MTKILGVTPRAKRASTALAIWAFCACASTKEDEGMWIGPEGGTLTYKSLTLVVPPGAVEERTLFEIESASGLDPAPEQQLIEAFELGPNGLAFHEPLRATVSKETGLTNVALYLSSSGDDWEQLDDSEYDADAGEANGSVPHFSFLSLQGAAEASGSGGSVNEGGAGPTTGGSSAEGGGQFGGATYGGEGGGGDCPESGTCGETGDCVYDGYCNGDCVYDDDCDDIGCEADGYCDEGCEHDDDCDSEVGVVGAGDYAWAAQVHRGASDWFRSMALDEDGNTYLANGLSAGDFFVFPVTKIDSSGSIVDEYELEPVVNGDFTPGVHIDRQGNGLTFGSVPAGLDDADIEYFVAKNDTSGQEVWSRLGGALGTHAEDVVVDDDGNVYVTGSTNSGDLDGEPDLHEGHDGFLVKYDSNGDRIWSRIIGTTWGTGSHVALAPDGGVAVAGHAQSIPGVGESTGSDDMLVVKYDADGVREWARFYGTVGVDRPEDVAVDTSGNVLVVGWLTDTENGGTPDIGLAKFGPTGSLLWSSRSGLPDEREDGYSVAADSSGNVFVAGRADTPFDGATSVGQFDIVLMKYTPDGDKEWTRFFGTEAEDDEGRALVFDASDSLHIGFRTRGHLATVNTDTAFDLGVIKYESDALD